MPRRLLIAVLPLCIAACGADTHPVWAMDSLYVEPQGDDVYALQTWEIFGDRWSNSFSKRHYVCSVIFELDGEPSGRCPGCEQAWEITSTYVESDCEDWFVEEAAFPEATGLGLGALNTGLATDEPFPDSTTGGRIEYDGGGFIDHGWAYPEALEHGGTPEATEWNADQAFVWWPAWVWEIRQDALEQER